MLYALLPNKKQSTYKKLFKMIKNLITSNPVSVNCDFEIAAINALKLVFQCKIYGCYFHFDQSFWRRVQTKKSELWYDQKFRETFRQIQALAFIPCCDVFQGFEIIKRNSSNNAIFFINYVQNNYIGTIRQGRQVSPRFPIELWNLHDRVKLDLQRTNNNVESWHSRIKTDARHNLTVNKVIEFFKLEQNNIESDLLWVRCFDANIFFFKT